MFRDETEAALARAEAAERKLAELERHGAQDDAEIEELKRTIAELRAEVARLRPPESVPAMVAAAEAPRQRPRPGRRLFLVCAFAVPLPSLFLTMLAKYGSRVGPASHASTLTSALMAYMLAATGLFLLLSLVIASLRCRRQAARARAAAQPSAALVAQARQLGLAALVTSLLLAANGPWLYGFVRSHLLGREVQAEALSVHHWTTQDSEGGINLHYMARFRIAHNEPHAGHVWEEMVPNWLFDRLQRGQRFPAHLVVGSPDTARLGPKATLHAAWIFAFLCSLFVVLALAYRALFRPAGTIVE